MKKFVCFALMAGMMFFYTMSVQAFSEKVEASARSGGKIKTEVRVAVIGGMTMTGMWQEVAKRFEAETGYKVVLVATGPRPRLAKALQEGKVDLLTMHSGDITTDLVADGYGIHMRPWTHNNLVVIGPPSDPAGIKGMKDGAAAFSKIAETQSNFVDYSAIGVREMCHKMWRKSNITPSGKWFLKDEKISHRNYLVFAREHNAYGVIGRMPVLFKKIDTRGMEIMVENDPEMLRPYIVMEANPDVFPQTNYPGAKALSDFLLSETIQRFLTRFRAEEFGGIPIFYPLRRAAFPKYPQISLHPELDSSTRFF